MQYNPPHNRKTQIRRHKHREDAKIITKLYLQGKVERSEDYAKYRTENTNMLLEFESTWDCPVERFEAAHHMNELQPEDMKPIQSAPYRAELKPGVF